MDLTPEEHEQMAQEYVEAIDVSQKMYSISNEDRIQVLKHVLDKEIGTDPSADLKSIPGLTPELTETITDPLLDIFAKVLNKILFQKREPEPV